MRKHLAIISSLFLLVAGLFAFPLTASAVDVIDPACDKTQPGFQPDVCKNISSSGNPLFGPDGIITNVVKIISFVVGIVAVIVIIIAGLSFITSGGDPQKANSSRQAVIYAAVGLFIASVAQLIVAFILNKVKS